MPGRDRAWAMLRRLVGASGILWLAALPAEAQGGRRTFLYVTGFALTVTNTTPADFDNGAVQIGTTTFTVDLTANNPNFSPRLTTVSIRCFAPCPTTGTLSPLPLQWRRGDLGTWNALTTTYAFVEERLSYWNGLNDPWSNTISFRYQLDWATSPPTPATAFQVQMQLTVAAP